MENNYVIKQIELEGMPNTRDLGGMPTKDGRHIRYKRLLRSGDLFNAADEGVKLLCSDYHLKKVIDLRTAGKDRAGLAAVLLLNALGAEEELILEDYLKVNEYARPVIELQAKLASERTGREEAGVVVEKLFSVVPSYLEAVYAEIDSDFGSMDVFLKQEMGLDAETRQNLQMLYLEP